MTRERPDRARLQSRLEFDPPLHPAELATGEPDASSPDLGSLPLFPEQGAVEREDDSAAERTLDLDPKSATAGLGSTGDPGAKREPDEGAPVERFQTGDRGNRAVSLASRFLAGLGDVAIHGAVVVLLLAGQKLLTSSSPSFDLLPAYGVFLLAFSFLYTVVPLAFWGQTPGMSAVGLHVCAADGENLTFPQTAMRWAIGLLTCALLGLPLLVALTGRSLGDRLGRSTTELLDP